MAIKTTPQTKVQPKQYKGNNRKNNKGNKESLLSKEEASDKEPGRKEQQQRTPGEAARTPVKMARENRKQTARLCRLRRECKQGSIRPGKEHFDSHSLW